MSIGWKNIELSSFLEGQYGNKIFNQTRYFTDFDNFTSGTLNKRVLQSYGKDGSSVVPFNSTNVTASSQSLASSYFIEDGSFLRMRNIQLSYTFGKSSLGKLGIATFTVFFLVENVFILTRYSGLDPEVNVQGVNANLNDISATVDANDKNYNLGIDQGVYPNPRSFIAGVRIKF